MKRKYAGYHLAKNYNSLTVYHFAANGSRMCTDRFTLLPGRTRQDRYGILCKHLVSFGFEVPPFRK